MSRRVTLRLTPLRLAAGSALIVSCAWLAWSIVTDTAGHALAETAPQAALRWNSREPVALVHLAEKLITTRTTSDGASGARLGSADPDDLAQARALLEKALAERPLDSHALALLALVAFQRHDARRGSALATVAGRLSWRDMLAQMLLVRQSMARHSYAGALAHADAILRTRLQQQRKIFPSLATFSANPASWRALGKFLATDPPPWRSKFLIYLCGHLRDSARLTRLYDEMQASGSPPTTEELRPLVLRLTGDGAYRQAYRIWRETLPTKRKPELAEPHNGNFAHSPDGMPFDWMFLPATGADTGIVNGPRMKGKALRIEFSGARVNFSGNVRQLMLLPPGSYRFAIKARARDLRTRRGVWWRIYCAGGDKKSLGNTKLIAGNLDWSDIGTDFTVPSQACGAQWLAVELPARFDFEKQIEGQVWFADARVRAIGAGETP